MRFSRTPQESWLLGMKPYKVHPMGLETEHTLSLNSMSALYPVFSHLMLTVPPSSAVIVPIKIPGDKKIENKLFSVSKGLLSDKYIPNLYDFKLKIQLKCTQQITEMNFENPCRKSHPVWFAGKVKSEKISG